MAQAMQCVKTLVQNSPEIVSWTKRKCVTLLVANSPANLKHSKIVDRAPENTRLGRKGNSEYSELFVSCSLNLYCMLWMYLEFSSTSFRKAGTALKTYIFMR